eukprot:SAG11_NODE_2787_length_2975_cov_2.383652_1_plen_193_part_00
MLPVVPTSSSSKAPAAHLELDNKLPFPALTPAQRYHYEVYGFVLLPEVLSATETAALLGELHELRAKLIAQADAAAAVTVHNDTAPMFRRYSSPEPGGAVLEQRRGPSSGTMDGLQNLSQVGGHITGYAVHPLLVAVAEELLGGEARLMQEDAIINRRSPADADPFAPRARCTLAFKLFICLGHSLKIEPCA